MDRHLNILLLGKTGNGKSCLGCTLVNDHNAFFSDGAVKSVTKVCKQQVCRYERYALSVVDTPGVFDTDVPCFDVFKEISSAVISSPDGYHAILFVTKYGQRFTEEEANAIDNLEKMFGEAIYRFAIIVVTNADTYYKEKRARPETTPEQRDYMTDRRNAAFHNLFYKCGGRFVFCDNFAEDVETEREKVLAEVKKLVSQNGGERYTHRLFIIAREALQKAEAGRREAELKRQEDARRYRLELAEKEKDRSTLLTCVEKMSGDELAKLYRNLSSSEQERVLKQVSPEVRKRAIKAGACFPRGATCILATGDVLKMEHLQQGDKVQVVLPDGTLDYQEVFMFTHADPNTKTSFLVFTTENQRQLSISPGHYLYVKGQDGKMAMISARDVEIDDALYTYDPKNGIMEFSAVTETKMETLHGLYNPHTKSGTIIVNGVLASCYTEAFSPVWAHRLLQPVWFLYKMAPWINRIVAKDGMPLWLSFLNIGKTAWEKIGLSAWQ